MRFSSASFVVDFVLLSFTVVAKFSLACLMNYFIFCQVKRIARRYKTQVDEQTKEMEELKKKAEESQTPGATAGAAAPTATSTAENADVASYEEKIKQLTDQVNTSEDEVKKLKELDEQNKVSRLSLSVQVRFASSEGARPVNATNVVGRY